MADTLFGDLRTQAGTRAADIEDASLVFEDNPLDQTMLRRLETEVAAVTGLPAKSRVRLTVCTTAEWQALIRKRVPPRLVTKGMHRHFRVFHDPQDPHHLFVGPSAVSGLNEAHGNVISDLLYHMIIASGARSNQAFERGATDLMVAEVADRLGLKIFAGVYQKERDFVATVIEAVRDLDEEPAELLGLLKRNPQQFFKRIQDSGFYRWWDSQVRADDRYARYANLIESMASPQGQLEGSFMDWACQCAAIYVDYRRQQRQNALAGAAKRAEG